MRLYSSSCIPDFYLFFKNEFWNLFHACSVECEIKTIAFLDIHMNEVYRGLHLYTLPILEKRVSLKKKRERDLKKFMQSHFDPNVF